MECEICGYYEASEAVVYQTDLIDLAAVFACDRCFDAIKDEDVIVSQPIAN